jgi:hypothetical protein
MTIMQFHLHTHTHIPLHSTSHSLHTPHYSLTHRMGDNAGALNLYKKIHRADPDNVECLSYLVGMTSGMQSAEYDGYRKMYAKLQVRICMHGVQ